MTLLIGPFWIAVNNKLLAKHDPLPKTELPKEEEGSIQIMDNGKMQNMLLKLALREGITLLLIGLSLVACKNTDPNLNEAGEDKLEINQVYISDANLLYRDTVYVPIYSELYYSGSQDITFYLTSTLSIRNTSLKDTIYIEDIDYYDTDGKLIHHYLDAVLLLHPMQSIEYIIEKNEEVRGTGANFVVNWGANNPKVKPLFQGVMASIQGQQGITLLTDGVSIRGE
ncbi:MAG: DUF3124 domain-containing protein [Bacteroidota bacterium]